MARGLQRRGFQCSCIDCIGIKPALQTTTPSALVSRLNCQKMLIQITFKDEGYDKHDSTKEQRNNETMSNVKLQVLTICYLSDLNNKFHY